MADKIRQRRGLLTIEAEIVSDGVHYRERSPFRACEFKVGLAGIDPNPFKFYSISRVSVIIFIFFAFSFLLRAYRVLIAHDELPGGLVVPALLLVLPAFGTWMYSARYIGFRTQEGGMMFFERAGSADPSPFLQRVRQARDEYLAEQMPHFAAGADARPEPRVIGFTAGQSAG